jgi:hypothetical protein
MAALFQQYIVQPYQAITGAILAATGQAWNAVRNVLMEFFGWWRGAMFQLFVEPWVAIWGVLMSAASAFWAWFSVQAQIYLVGPFVAARDAAVMAWQGISEALGVALQSVAAVFNQYVVLPVQQAWTAVLEFFSTSIGRIREAFQNAWNGLAEGAKAAFQAVVNVVGSVVNRIISMINVMIRAVNRVASAVPGAPMLSELQQVSVPAFAAGGVVNRPTLAMVGDGGEPEYIIPQSKMAQASANFLAGQRGSGVMGGGAGPINITTGPVMQQNGQNYATIEDLEMVAREVATQIYGTLRTPGGRRAMGIV